MNKEDFLLQLQSGLSGLPQDDIDERIAFYSEMIDDRIEEGLSEEEAVAAAGTVDDIVSQTVADIPLYKLVKEKTKNKRGLRAWEIVLIILGFPVLFPLLIAAFCVLLSAYIVIWAVMISLWAVEASFIAGALGGIAAGIVYICTGNTPQGFLLIGAALMLAGLSIFLFFGCVAATKGAAILTKKIALKIKSLFIGKENDK